MPVEPVYRKQLTDQPLPQVTPQSAGEFLRQSAQQQEELALKSYQKSISIYENEFSAMAYEKINDAYKRNEDNPNGLKAELNQLKPELLKPVKNTQLKRELELKFQMRAMPYIDRAEDAHRQKLSEQQIFTALRNFDSFIDMADDTAGVLYGNNLQASVNGLLAFYEGHTQAIKGIQDSDLSPLQKEAKISSLKHIFSTGARNYFDILSVRDKYKFAKEYKNKTAKIFIPDVTKEGGFKQEIADKFIDYNDYKRDVAYMEMQLGEYEKLVKKGIDETKAKIFAFQKAKTIDDLNLRLADFDIKDGIPQKNNNLDTMLAFSNSVDNALANEYITAEKSASYKEKIAEGVLSAIEETKLDSGNLDKRIFTDDVKSTFLLGTEAINKVVQEIRHTEDPFKEIISSEPLPERIFGMSEAERRRVQKQIRIAEQKKPMLAMAGLTEEEFKRLKKETRETDVGYNILKLNLITAYFNRLKEAGVDPKTMAKDDIEKAHFVLSNVLKTYAMKSNPLLMLERDVINKSLDISGYKPVEATPPQKLLPKKISSIPKGYELYQDNKTGRQILVKSDTVR